MRTIGPEQRRFAPGGNPYRRAIGRPLLAASGLNKLYLRLNQAGLSLQPASLVHVTSEGVKKVARSIGSGEMQNNTSSQIVRQIIEETEPDMAQFMQEAQPITVKSAHFKALRKYGAGRRNRYELALHIDSKVKDLLAEERHECNRIALDDGNIHMANSLVVVLGRATVGVQEAEKFRGIVNDFENLFPVPMELGPIDQVRVL